MQLIDLLAQTRVVCGLRSASKKRALEELSHLIVEGDRSVSQLEVFESLIARERLGSTGLGKGIAIPHGRLKTGTKAVAAFVKLAQGVDYDAPDGLPVDLLCALLVPANCSEEHLQVLALLSEMFSSPEFREKLRSATTAEALHALLVSYVPELSH